MAPPLEGAVVQELSEAVAVEALWLSLHQVLLCQDILYESGYFPAHEGRTIEIKSIMIRRGRAYGDLMSINFEPSFWGT